MRRLRQFLALSGLTALEALRQPICLLLTVSCVLLTALAPLLLVHNFGEEGRLARDAGLALHFVFGLLLAAYLASSCLARERHSGTVSSVLSKPVGRTLFFLAKFAGLVGVLLVFSVCACAATLLAERVAEKFVMAGDVSGYVTDWPTGARLALAPLAALLAAGALNYFRKRPFASAAFGWLAALLLAALVASGFYDRTGQWAPFHWQVQWRIVPASILVTLGLITLSAVALSLSTRLNAVPIVTVCGGVFVVGLMSDYLFGRLAHASRLAAALYWLTPNWQHFWVADALGKGGTVPLEYVARAALYGAVYAAAVLCLGAWAFRRAEMR
jgi:ABC-2 type transport system permease protein